MQRPVRAVATISAVVAFAHLAEARMVIHEPRGRRAVDFQMMDVPIGGEASDARTAQPAHLRGSSLAALPTGDALIMDADSGRLVRTKAGVVTGYLGIGRDAPQLVHDPLSHRAYVVDRRRDRVVVVDTSTGLRRIAGFDTPAEPFGIALTPDRKMLLVTTVADQTLVALDAQTGKAHWRTKLGPEPRGVAISPDGRRAIVTHLNSAAATWLELTSGMPKISYPSLNRSAAKNNRNSFQRQSKRASFGAANTGRSFARASFAGAFVSDRLAVVAHQSSTPRRATTGRENRGTYGGGGRFEAPIEHRITFVGERASERVRSFQMAQAKIGLHQPRALRYDRRRDTLYVTGFGSDNIIALGDVSQPSIHLLWKAQLPGGADGCAPSGVDVTDAGTVLVHCSFSRTLVTVRTTPKQAKASKRAVRRFRGKRSFKRLPVPTIRPVVTSSKALTQSRLSAAKRRGRRMFHRGGDSRMSSNGAMACASCHPEGRNDGLSWRLQG